MYVFSEIEDPGLHIRKFTSHLIDGLDGHDGRYGLYGVWVQERFDEFTPTGFYSSSLFEKIVKYHISDFPRLRGKRATLLPPHV